MRVCAWFFLSQFNHLSVRFFAISHFSRAMKFSTFVIFGIVSASNAHVCEYYLHCAIKKEPLDMVVDMHTVLGKSKIFAYCNNITGWRRNNAVHDRQDPCVCVFKYKYLYIYKWKHKIANRLCVLCGCMQMFALEALAMSLFHTGIINRVISFFQRHFYLHSKCMWIVCDSIFFFRYLLQVFSHQNSSQHDLNR